MSNWEIDTEFGFHRNTDFRPRRLPYGKHVFIWCRPKDSQDWSDFDGTTMRQGGEEFRPCKLSGHGDGQRVFVAGSPYGHLPEKFEFGPDCVM